MKNAVFAWGLWDIRMAGAAAWFQVNCPACDAALQVRLSEGNTEVVCAQCDKEFVVQVPRAHLAAATSQRLPQRKEPPHRRLLLGAYQTFMKHELRKVRKEHPELTKMAVWCAASAHWHDSPMNPARATAAHAADGDDANDEPTRGRIDAVAADTATNGEQSDDDALLDVQRVRGGRRCHGRVPGCGAGAAAAHAADGDDANGGDEPTRARNYAVAADAASNGERSDDDAPLDIQCVLCGVTMASPWSVVSPSPLPNRATCTVKKVRCLFLGAPSHTELVCV